jgi:hypothetical protein
MPGLGKPQQVAEHEAEGDIARIYHEIKQSLRVTGINLNFRTWAGYSKFFPAMWAAVRPNVETRAFENAADRLRAEAVHAADALGRLEAASRVQLGESQMYQLRAALHLYHYINPKLLILTSAVRLALEGTPFDHENAAQARTELIERGEPVRMYPMEMVADPLNDARLRQLFDAIQQTLGLSTINSDYRTLALWPDYLAAAWEGLQEIIKGQAYGRASAELRERASTLARSLPYPIPLSRAHVAELGEDVDELLGVTTAFERLLPALILNIALLELDWQPMEVLSRSPFPAAPRSLLGT